MPGQAAALLSAETGNTLLTLPSCCNQHGLQYKLTDLETTSLDCSSLLVILQDIKDTAQPDELTVFHHLKARQGMSQLELEDEVQTDLQHNQGLHKRPNVPHLHSPQLPLAAHWLSSSIQMGPGSTRLSGTFSLPSKCWGEGLPLAI